MRYFNAFIVIIAFLFVPASIHAQGKDTVFLMNGEIIVSTITDTAFYGVKVLRPGNQKKEMIIEGERVFSYKFANGFEKTVYFQDTLIGNEFNIEETRQFLVGERDAQRGFKSPLWPAGNVLIGTVSGAMMGNVLAFVPPFAYAAGSIIPKVKIRHSTVSNMNYLKSDTYILGYERVARKRRTLQSFIGGVVGLGIGFAARSIYNTVSK
jgi:hypothetical protein